ncbi:hypothetical protein [Spongiibacter sp.]|uniref:hypothetical protein n=1 Tax=Spongiibacter sp. TaxID=2024860 RepID=UPI00257EAC28|nr:hypothetical protein [Spongiibacter sp.]|tara:strand:- start:499 stop:714 length:216 start_codon:yes stop_codon:yes gene_type:complete
MTHNLRRKSVFFTGKLLIPAENTYKVERALTLLLSRGDTSQSYPGAPLTRITMCHHCQEDLLAATIAKYKF